MLEKLANASVGLLVRMPEEREGIYSWVIWEKLNVDSLQQSGSTLVPIIVDMVNAVGLKMWTSV